MNFDRLKKILNKFHENPSSGSQEVPFGGRTDINEANSLFCNFASAPKNHSMKPFVTFSLSPHIQVLNSSETIPNGKCKNLPVVDTQRTWKQKSKQRQNFRILYITYHNFQVLTMFGNTSH